MIGNSKKYFIVACLALIIIAGYASIYTVNVGEQVIVTQFGNVAKTAVTKPGLYLKIPFIQKVHYLPNHRIFKLTTGPISNQIEDYGVVLVEQIIRYKIGDPLYYFMNFGDELKAKETIIQDLKVSLAAIVENHGVFDLMVNPSNKQERFVRVKNNAKTKVLKEANALLTPKGIHIIELDIIIGT